MSTRMLTDRECQWAYEMWCRGYRREDIAAALFCSAKTIQREFDRRGYVRIRPVLIAPPDILGKE